MQTLVDFLAPWLQALGRCGRRYPLVLAGEAAWGRRLARDLLRELQPQALWLGNADEPDVAAQILPTAQAGRLLGQECDILVFDAHAGFSADAFGLASGCVRGGGLLLMLTPELARWPGLPDSQQRKLLAWPRTPGDAAGRFLTRLGRLLASDEECILLRQSAPWPELPRLDSPPELVPAPDPHCLTRDQAQAVAAIEKVVSGHRRRPLVVDADRGRGKSAALGIAAARLLQGGLERILLTAPRRLAVRSVFEQAGRVLPDAEIRGGNLYWRQGRLQFLPPDRLAAEQPPADLLLVDEAAALPAPLLERLLRSYSRVVFASTVHGYEGSGRSFALRFRRLLDRHSPGWCSLRLQQPIRWRENDPLEGFVFRALLLDAEPAPAPGPPALADCRLQRLDRDRLAADEPLLRQVFSLLVSAHYRTTPSDLQSLLDNPDLEVFAFGPAGEALAIALVVAEGGLPRELAAAIYRGRRRVQGHLLAQSLAAHLDLEQGPELRLARVMRIAVHPRLQGRGLGSRLLAELGDWAEAQGFQALGTSFGANRPLLRFWRRAGLEVLRLGFRREHSSGEHSVLMLKPFCPAAKALFREARAGLGRRLAHELAEPLRELDPWLAADLLRGSASQPMALDAADRRQLEAFARHRRGYEVSLPSLHQAALGVLTARQAPLHDDQRALLVAKLLQRRGWDEVATLLGHAGRGGVETALRETFACVLDATQGSLAQRKPTSSPAMRGSAY